MKSQRFAPVAMIPAVIILCFADYLSVDYGWYGVLLIILIYLTGTETRRGLGFATLWIILFSIRMPLVYLFSEALFMFTNAIPLLSVFSSHFSVPELTDWGLLQICAALSATVVMNYNGCPGWRPDSHAARKTVRMQFYFFIPYT